ncbi:MAG: hypothetical protein KGL02_02100, partial [Acidobacteriota bacterium]|nr:hypothetical protein [Acidobacteriota bacterium]
LGKLMAEFRRTTSDVRGTVESHLRDMEREANERKIDSVRPASGATANTGAPQIATAEGIVPASAPHEAAVAAASPPAESGGQPLGTPPRPESSADNFMMYPEDPEELIRQAEAQIARERAGELENPERVSDGAIGKP